MSPRTLACMFGAATALSAQIAIALGLGEIKLNSTLNQPLDAEIRLLQVRDLSQQEILIGLASADDFRRVGVDRPFFLSDLQFDVDLSNPQQPVVHITSDKPVREPFLNFVVEAQWPSGRLLREYTLLMDLPVYAQDQQAQPVQPAGRSTSGASQPSQTTGRSQPAQQPLSPAERQAQPAAGSTYGPVKSSDNLWNIAAVARPDRSVSVQQAMIAIQRANPGAFINDNINLLRQGQVLRIPSRDEMTQLSAREAIAEVAYQNQSWSNRGETTAQAPQLEGSRSYSAPNAEPSQPEGRVKLSSPQDYSNSAEGRGTGTGGGNTEALENELAVTLEELDRTKGENAELKSRLESLEAQIETMERLLDVSNEELRAMQLAAQQQQQAADEASAEGEQAPAEAAKDSTAVDEGMAEEGAAGGEQPAEGAVSEAPDEAGTTESEVEQSTARAAQTAPATEMQAQPESQAAEPERDPTRVVRPVSEPKNSWLDLVMENILFIGLGLVALLAALAVFLRSRKKSSGEDDFDDFLTEPQAEQWEETDEFETAPTDEEYESLASDEEEGVVVAAEPESAEEHAEQETEDAVAEAEIYIALAKYDQAEDILLRALEKDPSDVEARLKLLELYATQQDVASFDPHYARLHVLGDDQAISRAEDLREKIAGAPAFDRSRFDTTEFAAVVGAGALAAGAAAASHDADEDFSFDLDLGSLDEESDQETHLDEEINASLGDTDSLNDFDLELDLDNELDEAGDAARSETVIRDVVDDESDLDFDFELDTDDMAETGQEDAEEADVDDEFAFDLGLDDLEEDSDTASVVKDDGGALDVDDVSAADLDFSSALEESSTEEDRAVDSSDSSIDFELEDERRPDESATADDQHGIDFDLGGLDLDGSHEDGIEAEEPETLEDSVEEDLESSFTGGGDEDDDLNLDAEMDLSALDEELEAMTSDLGADMQKDFAIEEEPELDKEADSKPAQQDVVAEDEILAAAEEPATLTDVEDTQAEEDLPLMEEPLTDFGDLDDFLGTGGEAAEAEAGSDENEVEAQELESRLSMEDEPLEELDAELTEVEANAASEAEEPSEQEAAPLSEQAETEDDELPDYEALMASADTNFDLEDIDPESEDDSDLGFLSDSDETATKLDLARAYIDMGDADGAKDILEEIMQEGNDDQRKEAQQLLERV